MNTLLLPPPHLHLRLHLPHAPPFFCHRHHHHLLLLAASKNQQLSFTAVAALSGHERDIAELPNPKYNFTPLLSFLSAHYNLDHPPAALDLVELWLAESYGAVPAPLWHSLIKNLSSSPSSFSAAFSRVTWLQKHNLCFSYEHLYSILIHALGRNEKLYEAFLLSQRHGLTPLTYNALIGACARNDDLEKALNLIERKRRDGFFSATHETKTWY